MEIGRRVVDTRSHVYVDTRGDSWNNMRGTYVAKTVDSVKPVLCLVKRTRWRRRLTDEIIHYVVSTPLISAAVVAAPRSDSEIRNGGPAVQSGDNTIA